VKEEIKAGLKAGVLIGLGYFTVSFAFGMQALSSGLTVLQSVLISLTNLTSAGQFAALPIIANGSYFEMVLTQFIINLRYALMSCALSQKLDKTVNNLDRFLMAFGITDEIFGVDATKDGKITAGFHYAVMLPSMAGWVSGTALGAICGNIMPAAITSAMGIALYAMFAAIILPPAYKNKAIGICIIVTIIASYVFSIAPVLKEITSGFKIIILTIVISGAAALIAPVEEEKNE